MRVAAGLSVAVGVTVLLSSLPASAQYPFRSSQPPGTPDAPPTPQPGRVRPGSPLPVVRIGALLPLSGASSWYGLEMRRGLELAIAELGRAGAGRTEREAPSGEAPRPAEPDARGREGASPLGVQLALEALDVDPLNPRQALERFAQLLARPLPVVFTASATPTLAVQQEAAKRDVLVVHQGLVTGRFPPESRGFIHTRPPLAARAEALADHARERGLAKVALLAAGDEFGKTVRAVVSARWRQAGPTVVFEASLSLDAPDLGARLRELARLAPEAVLLGFHGVELGDLARAIREAGYAGLLLALDDDPGARLAAGPALDGAVILVDAFVPDAGSAGARFAESFRKRFGADPSRYAANAYEAVGLVAAGIQAAREAGGDTPGGARLRQTLLARRAFPSLSGGQLLLREDGVIERPLALFTVTRGALSFIRHLAPSLRGAASEAGSPRLGRV